MDYREFIRKIRGIGKRKGNYRGRKEVDPTPEEISAMCLEIRKGWGPVTEWTRLVKKPKEFALDRVFRIADSD